MTEFDPNKSFIGERPQWSTYVTSRSPKFKLHTKKNHATAALTTHRGGIIYQWIDDQWVERSRYPTKNPDQCAHCGDEEVRYENAWRVFRIKGGPEEFTWERPMVCYNCYVNFFTNRPKISKLRYEDIGKTQLRLDI
jgi:hypothetical protein